MDVHVNGLNHGLDQLKNTLNYSDNGKFDFYQAAIGCVRALQLLIILKVKIHQLLNSK